MTAHNNAKKEEIAKIVIMPGDPLRAKLIAEKYLNNYKLVNSVRNIYAYTGYYKNKLITVMASGMGMGSMGIYSYELYKFYDVDLIIRVGTCGTYYEDVNLFDIIVADKVVSDSTFALVQNGYDKNYIESDNETVKTIQKVAEMNNLNIKIGQVYSTDVFYNDTELKLGKESLAVEMESFALFHNAKILNKKAACILTVSDNLITKEQATAEQRQNSFTKMIELALETAIERED